MFCLKYASTYFIVFCWLWTFRHKSVWQGNISLYVCWLFLLWQNIPISVPDTEEFSKSYSISLHCKEKTWIWLYYWVTLIIYYENLIPRPHCFNALPNTQWKPDQWVLLALVSVLLLWRGTMIKTTLIKKHLISGLFTFSEG